MKCWQPSCPQVPTRKLTAVFRANESWKHVPLRITLRTVMCEGHANEVTVDQVLDAGLWKDVLAAATRLIPKRELTTLEWEPFGVGDA